MYKIMEKFNKLSLPAVILMASIILGGFFYASQVNKQRSIERQQQVKIKQEKQNQLTKELKEQETKEQAEQSLNTCIADAETNYSNNWRNACKTRGELSNRCVALLDMTFEEYKKQNSRKSDVLATEDIGKEPEDLSEVIKKVIEERESNMREFYKERDKCSCGLPLEIADRRNKTLQDDKDECFKKYPQK